MAATGGDMQAVVRNILRDLRVELTDEFDKNFERQGFFSEAWQRRRSPVRPGGTTLVDTGALRRSIGSRIEGDSIVFTSTLPYAAIHNEGGEIAVTARMRRYFWAKYYEASGSFGRRKDGSRRQDKRTKRLETAAEFWKCMALMRVGQKIRIPKRAFLGYAPEVEQSVREIIEENLTAYFKHIKLQ
jgi:phage gpG-like protein